MKKLIFSLIFFTNVALAQTGLEVEIEKIPEKIKILPGVYEFFGVVKGTTNQFSYVLSINEELVDTLKDAAEEGQTVSFLGPKLEKLVQQKVINDYAEKRKEIEAEIQGKIDSEKLKASPSKEKIKAWKKELKQEQLNTADYLERLEEIVVRYGVNCIYAYNFQIGNKAGNVLPKSGNHVPD